MRFRVSQLCDGHTGQPGGATTLQQSVGADQSGFRPVLETSPLLEHFSDEMFKCENK